MERPGRAHLPIYQSRHHIPHQRCGHWIENLLLSPRESQDLLEGIGNRRPRQCFRNNFFRRNLKYKTIAI